MTAQVLDLQNFIEPDHLAVRIATKYQEWESLRHSWLAHKMEIRNYIFATDTHTTSTSHLPWKNSTHVPKLCQIRDNLHANYMAALFPNDRPIVWEGDDEASETKDKRLTIESYMENKMRMSGFRTEVSKCVLDWIDYGDTYAGVEFVAEHTKDPETGEDIPGYVGPKLVRISPLDLVYNPVASDFNNTPKIKRAIKTLGTLKAEIDEYPELGYQQEVFTKLMNLRHRFSGMSQGDFAKSSAMVVDGFSSYLQYFQSDYVEIMDFYGDLYDHKTDTFYKNYLISVVDRSFIIRMQPNPSWLGKAPIFHCGWRLRPDNLYSMGPLDNLVGMQYRIDHLENAKADAFDLIVHPVMKVKGFVEDFDYGPGERIFVGDEGDVTFMPPDTTMLNADTQIAMYEQKMEEMAGAPKQAMGFRTPGEKTAYEVQILENGSNRIFLNKTAYFEEIFMEPALNAMLETARRNMGLSDLVRVVDDQFGVVNFMKITRDDLAASGKIRPIGARHFARNANILQNITQFSQSPLGQDASVNVHLSGKKIAELVPTLLDLERYDLYQPNIRVAEQLETQRLVQAGSQILQEEGAPQSLPGQPAPTGAANGPPVVQQSSQGKPGAIQATGPGK